MKRRDFIGDFIKATTTAAASLALPSLPYTTPQKAIPRLQPIATPDIILIIADDLAACDISPGNPAIDYTPNIQALADEGTTYTRFYTTPACSPSRWAMMTGAYGPDYGVTHVGNAGIMAYPGLSIAERLKQAGYATNFIGKWHLVGQDKDGSGVSPFTGETYYYDPLTRPEANGFDYYYETRTLKADNLAGRVGDKIFFTPLMTHAAMERIRVTPLTTPLFLCVAYHAPHTPHHIFSTDTTSTGYYTDAVAEMDKSIGYILDQHRWAGRPDPIIIFVSDNGRDQNRRIDGHMPDDPRLTQAIIDSDNVKRWDTGPQNIDVPALGWFYEQPTYDANGDIQTKTAKGSVYEGGCRNLAFAKFSGQGPSTDNQLRHISDIYATIEQQVFGAVTAEYGIDMLGPGHPQLHLVFRNDRAVVSGSGWKLNQVTGGLNYIGDGGPFDETIYYQDQAIIDVLATVDPHNKAALPSWPPPGV